jgi:cell division protein FtsW (lipid II flippase)
MSNSNGKGNNDTGLMDAAGGLALIPFFLAAAMIFVIGVAIAFIWVPIVLIVVWAMLRSVWNLRFIQPVLTRVGGPVGGFIRSVPRFSRYAARETIDVVRIPTYRAYQLRRFKAWFAPRRARLAAALAVLKRR